MEIKITANSHTNRYWHLKNLANDIMLLECLSMIDGVFSKTANT